MRKLFIVCGLLAGVVTLGICLGLMAAIFPARYVWPLFCMLLWFAVALRMLLMSPRE